MALGLLLCISLICFLLLDGGAGFPAQKGHMNGYSHGSDSRNLAEEYSSYNNPLTVQQPELVSAEQILPYTPTPEVQRPVNDKPIEGVPEDPNKPLVFPLRPMYQLRDPAMPQPGALQPRSASLNAVSQNGMPHYLSSDDATYYDSAAAYYDPALISTSQADLWQYEPEREYGVDERDSKTGYSAHGRDWNNRRLVFEEVFHYPAELTGSSSLNYGADSNATGGYSDADYMSMGSSVLDEPSFPSYAVDEESQPIYAPEMQSSFPFLLTGEENLNSAKTSYLPDNQKFSWLPQKPGPKTQKASQREGEQGQSYINHPGDGYQQDKSWHSPELPTPVPVSSTAVERAAESNHPKGVKNALKEPTVTPMGINGSK